MASKLTYEVECELDRDIVADYDAWLPGHVQDVLACAGFLGAAIEAPETPPGEPQRRLIRYELESAAALDHYLENDAPRLRTETAQRFGPRVRCTRRALRPRHDLAPSARAPATCLDCGAAVEGAYCARCGQSADVHVLSMKEVAGDVTHSLLHLDSRVWRTLRALVLRPGELTREFIAGRHQRYLPPFRLYLAISVIFFALSAALPGSGFVKVDRDGDAVIAPVEIRTGGEPTPAGERAPPDAIGVCEPDVQLPLLGDVSEPLRRACLQIRADGGARLAERFTATAPKLMFLFLPLMAAVALLFYWRPQRLYTEHLVLFLHNHAFTYILLAATEVVNAIASIRLPLISVLSILNLPLFGYLFYYVFRSMRVVYDEGRAKTAFKFAAIILIYFILLGVTMLAGLLYSILQLA